MNWQDCPLPAGRRDLESESRLLVVVVVVVVFSALDGDTQDVGGVLGANPAQRRRALDGRVCRSRATARTTVEDSAVANPTRTRSLVCRILM